MTSGGTARSTKRARVFTTYPMTDASRRLRIQPLVHKLEQIGYSVNVDEIFTNRSYQWKNSGGIKGAYSALVVLARLAKRMITLLTARRVDVLIVHREAFPFFTPIFEKLVARKATVSVLDVDDAVHFEVTHGRDWRRFLRRPSEALQYANIFDIITCGNFELMSVYGSKKANVIYAPTCPELAVHEIPSSKESTPYEVVWIGSQSTLPSLCAFLPQIKEALEKTSSKMLVLGGDNVFTIGPTEQIDVARWSRENELNALVNSRVGIMPLPDTEWERGKSGYKAILYMCAGLAAIVSPIGFNKTLCEQYGAIACEDAAWVDVLADMLENLRQVSEPQLARIRSDFNPEKVAADIIKAIQDELTGRVANVE